MTAIAIFVKTPGLSAIKTRLAATIGAEHATRLYSQCAAAVAEAASAVGLDAVYWATAEPIERIDGWWPDLPLLEQGNGGLGERMHHVLAQLVHRHGSGMLLGADAPQLDPTVLRHAADWLRRETASSVLGPATDGGFWTFGANHLPALSRWIQVPYSHPDTLRRFKDAIGDHGEWHDLPRLTDLDTAKDLPRVAAELAALPQRLPRQNALLEQLLNFNPES